jgi:hypothetical protein
MKKLSLVSITALTILALALAGIGAYFSIFGLSKLFLLTPIILLVSVLEVIKIAVVTLINQTPEWKKTHRIMRTSLFVFVAALMLVTSVGIFGYLSSGYTTTTLKLKKNAGTIELLEKKDTIFKQEKARYEDMIKTKTERAKTLSKLNVNQETRIDSMYRRGLYYNANRIENITAGTTENIKTLNKDIDELNNKIKTLDDSISKYDLQIIDVNNNDVSRDVGPLKYVAESIGTIMDTFVKWLIVVLLFVSDPLAVVLVIAINILIRERNKPKEHKIIEEKQEVQLSEKEQEVQLDEKKKLNLRNRVDNSEPIEIKKVENPIIEETNESEKLEDPFKDLIKKFFKGKIWYSRKK